MQRVFFFICCIIFTISASSQTDTLLQRQLDSLLQIDQQVQMDMINASVANASKQTRDSLENVKSATFKRHIHLLKNIINEKGLPTYSSVGKTHSDNFFILANHSFDDTPFQEKVVEIAKKELKRKNISGSQLAMLIDKMRIKSGRNQIYGTQCTYTASEAIAADLEKPASVDKRRKKMGLPPLKEYLDMMTEFHKKMNEKH